MINLPFRFRSYESEWGKRPKATRSRLAVDFRCSKGALPAGRHGRRGCGCRVFAGKVVAVPKILVERPGQFGGARTKGRPAALKEEDRHQAALRRIGVGDKPSEAGSVIRAGASLA